MYTNWYLRLQTNREGITRLVGSESTRDRATVVPTIASASQDLWRQCDRTADSTFAGDVALVQLT